MNLKGLKLLIISNISYSHYLFMICSRAKSIEHKSILYERECLTEQMMKAIHTPVDTQKD